jgi:lysophospholipase L1-like esterase
MSKSLKTELTHRYNRHKIYDLFPTDSNSIVFLGDSQTEFFDLPEFFNNKNIINRGIARDRTSQILDRLNQITKGHPKKIFLQVGINDLSLNKEANINSTISVEKSFANIKQILNQIHQESPSTKIYYQNTFPFSYVIDEVKELNNKTASLCKENKIIFIDLFTDFLEENNLKHEYDCGDGLHLNGKGYSKWRDIIKKYVEE